MKYIFLFCNTAQQEQEWANVPEQARAEMYAPVMKWFEEYGPKFRGGHELQPTSTATTVRPGPDGQAIVTDGPFVEGNEVIGGYAEVEVDDLDEAIAMAKKWPVGSVEIRPVVTQ